MFNMEDMNYWRGLVLRQNRLLTNRGVVYRLSRQKFLATGDDWHISDVYGPIRRNKESGTSGVAAITRNFLVNFLVTGWIAFPENPENRSGAPSWNINLYPVENLEAREMLITRLYGEHRDIPPVPKSVEGSNTIYSLANKVINRGVTLLCDENNLREQAVSPRLKTLLETRDLIESVFRDTRSQMSQADRVMIEQHVKAPAIKGSGSIRLV